MTEERSNTRQVSWFRLVVTSLVVLTLLSGYVIIYNAGTEPFTTFLAFQVILQVGGSCVLLVSWLAYIVGVIYGISRRRISAWTLLSLVWVYLVCDVLIFAMMGYIGDIQSFSHV